MKQADQRIRIAFIIHKLWCGGSEKALFDLVTLMDKERFDISVFCQQGGGPWEQKFKDAGIRLVYDHSCQKPSNGNWILKCQNWIKKRKMFQSLKQDGAGLMELCYPEGLDIIVSYAVEWRTLTGFSRNAKTVKYIHGDVETNEDYCKLIRRQMDVMGRFDKIICVSNEATASFEKMTGIRENVCTIFNPLNSDHVHKSAQEPVQLPKDVPVMCAVGRLSPEKGFDRLIQIHSNLLNKGYRHRLVIVGEGHEREKLEHLIRQTGTEDTVQLVGYQSNPYPYMKSSSFLVCSSYTEGLPVIAMECLSLGIPIISAVPAVGEIFGDEPCGIVTENDDSSLEAGIESVLSNKDHLKKMQEGAKYRSAFFDGRRMVAEVENVFADLVKK